MGPKHAATASKHMFGGKRSATNQQFAAHNRVICSICFAAPWDVGTNLTIDSLANLVIASQSYTNLRRGLCKCRSDFAMLHRFDLAVTRRCGIDSLTQ